MSKQDDGTANVTAAELEAAKTRPHPVDTKPFVDGLKKILKSHKAGGKNMFRIHTYQLKELHDGWMLKLEVIRYFDGRSGGSRWIKGYLSEEKKIEFEKQLDSLPRKKYIDSRSGKELETPMRVDKLHRDAPTDLDLENLWDTTIKD